MTIIISALKLGGRLLLIALILQLVVVGSAFAFHNVDFSGGSTWHQDGSQGGSAWWDAGWDDDQSSGFNGWGKQPEQNGHWWDW